MRSLDLLAHYRALGQQSLTAVDVETTGSRAGESRVIEIAYVQGNIREGITDQAVTLINPGVTIPDRIVDFTGISNAMIAPAPTPAEVWPAYLPSLCQGVLTAHNLSFDYSFLQAEYRLLGQTYARPKSAQCCTVLLSRLLLSHLPSRRLPALVKYFQFPVTTSHRAAADAMACWLLARELFMTLFERSDEDLLALFGRQALSLGAIAHLGQCSPPMAQAALDKAGITPLYTNTRGIPYYRRDLVEQITDWPTAP